MTGVHYPSLSALLATRPEGAEVVVSQEERGSHSTWWQANTVDALGRTWLVPNDTRWDRLADALRAEGEGRLTVRYTWGKGTPALQIEGESEMARGLYLYEGKRAGSAAVTVAETPCPICFLVHAGECF